VKVLHVVASRDRRGAEVFAADLIHENERDSCQQSLAVLRGGSKHVQFDVTPNILANGGASRRVRAPVRLRSLVGEVQPDVIQAHGGESLKYSVFAASATPVVYRRVGGSPPPLAGAARRSVYRALMRRAARIVAVAEAIRRDTLREFRLGPDRIVTIPNGVDPERIAPRRARDEVRRELGIDPSAPVMLSVGSLSWEKDPLVHLDVAREVSATHPDLVHLMVGDGPMQHELVAAVAGFGVTRLLGTRPDVGDLMAASDVLLFASRQEGMEGMPAIAIEAAMLGLPFAGFDVAGVGEVVTPCRSGILVPYGDRQGLTEVVGRLLDDRDVSDRIRVESPSLAKKFDIANVAAQYRALYEEVAAGR
jgi:glycosyltransferase involved in cell wall biosynthesis